ncbi:hypothetical protein BMS3Bbin15_00925 [archaeon BMS3Bbin15]|nr:hypothetical protein BMS3Bbin15_00925 [archaeon BMS3Bbin15]
MNKKLTTHWPSYARSLKREAKKLVEAGNIKSLYMLIDKALGIGDAYYRAQALAWVARRIQEAGYDSSKYFLKAVETTEKVPQEWKRSEILVNIAYEMSMAEVKDFKPLLRAVESIDNEEHRRKAIKAVSRRMTKLGLKSRASPEPKAPIIAKSEKATMEKKEINTNIPPIKNKKKSITMGLYNTYSGKSLRVAHIRAIARAAPLCYAFNLNLSLFGFPVETPEEIVEKVENETRVGKEESYIKKLFEEGRLSVLDFPEKQFQSESGELVATTPHPDPRKKISIEKISISNSSFCLLMGLGNQGIPGNILKKVKYHLELTDRNIPLETCTAMGVLAAKLG